MDMRRPVILLAIAVLMPACGRATEGIAVVASSQGSIGVGEQRIITALLNEDETFVNDPDLDMQAEFRFDDERVMEVDAEFVWAIENVRGFYAIDMTFDRPGIWELVLVPEGRPPTPPSPFLVVEDPQIPDVGEPAPRSVTKTIADHSYDEMTTDPEPDPRFYQMSVDEAVGNGRPTVIVFATPAFCTSATCGPTLEVVKQVASSHPAVDFVHVEVYDNLDAPAFGELVVVPAVEEWQLPSEPWVYVVDGGGVISARFEGTVGRRELEAALTDAGG